MIAIPVIAILLFFGFLFFAATRRLNIKAYCKLPLVNFSLEAQQPPNDISHEAPSTDKR